MRLSRWVSPFALIVLLASSPSCTRSEVEHEDQGQAAVTARILETALKREGIDAVEVTMHGRIAILDGVVLTLDERARAEEVARRQARVDGVQNRLQVRAAPWE